MEQRVRDMTMLSMFIAIIVAMAMIPQVGFFQYGVVAITLLHIPVIIGTLYGGLKYGIVLGAAFGVFSMFIAFLRPGAVDVIFQNPILAITPRVLFGIATWYIFVGLGRLIDRPALHVGLTFVLGTFVHTVFTLTFLAFFQTQLEEVYGQLITLLQVVIPINGTLEMALAALIGTPITLRLMASPYFNSQERSE